MATSPSAHATRRTFLKSLAAASASAAAGPLILNAQDKADARRPRVGQGEYLFECHHGWGSDQLPPGHHYGNASHGVAIAADGMVYITHQGDPGSIFVFDPDGRFVRAMGEAHHLKTGQGHGIDIRSEDGQEFLYLSPSHSALGFTKMTLDGEVVWHKDRQAINKDCGLLDDPKTRFRPTNTSFRPDGGYYLGDGYGSNYVFQYDKHDAFVRALGGSGTTAGKFQTPHGQWLDNRDGTPKLVVADRANARLQWFDMQGNHLKTQGDFLFPADIDAQGDLLLVPDLHARVTLLGASNQVLVHLGDDPAWREQVLDKKIGMRAKPQLWQPGRFVHPHDACFDADGNIYVTEWVVTGRVTKLVRV